MDNNITPSPNQLNCSNNSNKAQHSKNKPFIRYYSPNSNNSNGVRVIKPLNLKSKKNDVNSPVLPKFHKLPKNTSSNKINEEQPSKSYSTIVFNRAVSSVKETSNQIPNHSNVQSDVVNSCRKPKIEGKPSAVSNEPTVSSSFKTDENISANGETTNTSGNVLRDQFGMLGLGLALETIKTKPDLCTLIYGMDVLKLGLNLNISQNVYPTFSGPFASSPLEPLDTDHHVPPEYLFGNNLRLPPINLSTYSEEIIFFLFYTRFGDNLQMLAAKELYARDWRYHKKLQVWIRQVTKTTTTGKTISEEWGTYCVFDSNLWRKVEKELVVEYQHLELNIM